MTLMKQSWKDKKISKCIKLGNKHPWCKPLMLVCIAGIVLWNRGIRYLVSNRKRMIGFVTVFLVFMVSSSFSSQTFQREMTGGEMVAEAYLTETEYSEEVELSELEAAYDTETDKYTLEEILQNNDSIDYYENTKSGTELSDNFSEDDWNLVLINKQHPIPKDYTFTLGNITDGMKCDERIIPDLLAMLQAAKDDGVNLVICSPYRDMAKQEVLFNRKINNYMAQGYSYLEAYKKSSQSVTVPGASEHQLGLALDIVSDTYWSLNEQFGKTKAGQWLEKNSREYGFILRYPKGKEYITGITFEPWHFRYVGKEAAKLIMDQGITLEEFVESISQ